jgi:type II secretion system protein H
MRNDRGFTLVELMVVVALTSVMAGLALVSVRKAGTQNDVDRMAAQVRDAITMANRRAVFTGRPYMIDVQKHSVQWCEVTAWTPSPLGTTQLSCANGTGEKGSTWFAGNDAQIAFYATQADTGGVSVSKATLTTAVPIYFGPLGTADTAFTNVMSRGKATTGVTVYIRRQLVDEPAKRRRVIAYGLSARPKVIDNY